MKKESKWITVTVAVGIFMVLMGMILAVMIWKRETMPAWELNETIADCIAENSVLYVSEGCIQCREQEKIFGEYYGNLVIVDCLEGKRCLEADIIRVPTWIIDGDHFEGVQSLEFLTVMTGCK